MISENRSKINRLITQWPAGTVAVQPWLTGKGYYQQLVAAYVRSGWLVRIGRGAYARTGDQVDWTGGLYAMQEQMGLGIHAGGETALELHGYGQFSPPGAAPLWLFGQPGDKLSAWFRQCNWGRDVRYSTTGMLSVAADGPPGLVEFPVGGWYAIRISSPERAILEVLYKVQDDTGIERARFWMERLSALRPLLVRQLLEVSNSVKVNRLFMCLAERERHPWIDDLELSGIGLGRGKRALVKGGQLDAKYQITLPNTAASDMHTRFYD